MTPRFCFAYAVFFCLMVLIPVARSSRIVAGEARTPKVYAKLGLHHTGSGIGPLVGSSGKQVVIRNAEELVSNCTDKKPDPKMSKDRALQMKCEAELAKLLKVDTIDWDKQMVVAVWGFGPNRSSEKFEFVSFAVKGENLTVGWRNKEGDGDYSRPKGVALVERFNGKVLFSQK